MTIGYFVRFTHAIDFQTVNLNDNESAAILIFESFGFKRIVNGNLNPTSCVLT
jgi:hypothetical protein